MHPRVFSGVLTGNYVICRGIPSGAHTRNRKLGFPVLFHFFFFSFFFHFIILHICFHSTCLTSNKTSFSNPFTGYLPAIFIGSAFNDYISYKSLLFSDMLCSTPCSLSRLRWIFCYIFRDLLTFYSLIVRFCWFFFVNFLSITTFLDSFL